MIRTRYGWMVNANTASVRAVVVAQLAERLLLTSEIRGTNPNINEVFLNAYICHLQFKRDENKEKEAGNGPASAIASVSCCLPTISLLETAFLLIP